MTLTAANVAAFGPATWKLPPESEALAQSLCWAVWDIIALLRNAAAPTEPSAIATLALIVQLRSVLCNAAVPPLRKAHVLRGCWTLVHITRRRLGMPEAPRPRIGAAIPPLPDPKSLPDYEYYPPWLVRNAELKPDVGCSISAEPLKQPIFREIFRGTPVAKEIFGDDDHDELCAIVEALVKLCHRAIMPCYGATFPVVDRADDMITSNSIVTPYSLVTERGEPLLPVHESTPLAQRLRALFDLAEGLRELHAAGLMHAAPLAGCAVLAADGAAKWSCQGLTLIAPHRSGYPRARWLAGVGKAAEAELLLAGALSDVVSFAQLMRALLPGECVHGERVPPSVLELLSACECGDATRRPALVEILAVLGECVNGTPAPPPGLAQHGHTDGRGDTRAAPPPPASTAPRAPLDRPTPRLFAAANSWDARLALVALEDGAAVNATNVRGETPLLAAVSVAAPAPRASTRAGGSSAPLADAGQHELSAQLSGIVATLLERGADVNARRSDGATALTVAARRGHGAVVAALLERGADVSARNVRGETPLHIAAMSGHAAIVATLLQHGADVNAVTAYETSPLLIAAARGHKAAVAALLERGADPLACERGTSPLATAAHNGRDAIVSLMVDAVCASSAAPPSSCGIHVG